MDHSPSHVWLYKNQQDKYWFDKVIDLCDVLHNVHLGHLSSRHNYLILEKDLSAAVLSPLLIQYVY